MWRRAAAVSLTVLKYGCLTHCVFTYVGDFVVCAGPSMEPTLHQNNILLTEHISPMMHKIQKGDIVIAKNPHNPAQNICKRVTGMPGDMMRAQYSIRKQLVPRGHVWLEGDNSSNSSDSRAYGPVPQGLIRSRALVRIWPPESVGFLA